MQIPWICLCWDQSSHLYSQSRHMCGNVLGVPLKKKIVFSYLLKHTKFNFSTKTEFSESTVIKLFRSRTDIVIITGVCVCGGGNQKDQEHGPSVTFLKMTQPTMGVTGYMAVPTANAINMSMSRT